MWLPHVGWERCYLPLCKIGILVYKEEDHVWGFANIHISFLNYIYIYVLVVGLPTSELAAGDQRGLVDTILMVDCW